MFPHTRLTRGYVGLRNLVKMIENKPKQFSDCLVFARLKFQAYFNHIILQLIHAFPLDMLMKDGSSH